jgi:hypothetical protein
VIGSFFILCVCSATPLPAQATQQDSSKTAATEDKSKSHIRPNDAGAAVPTRSQMLRGAYGPYRANNDLLYYHLDIGVDPIQKLINGKNTIRFRMLKEDTRIRLDLSESH